MIYSISSKTIAVVGGAGFIGSHTADALSAAGHKVRIYDRIESPWLLPNQEMVVGDLLDANAIREFIKGSQIVFHFAALADLNAAKSCPVDTVRINIQGTVELLEACRLHSIERFIYASSMYVYSREGSFYRCSKQAAEAYVEEYQQSYNLNYTILRYGSLYGPRSDNTNGLYRIVKHALETGVVSYQGSPDSLREYIHVEDAAKASVAALGDEFCNQSVVLTGQEPMRVQDLLEMLSEILGSKSPVEFVSGAQPGHYVRTPYAYQPKIGRKYVPPMHVDLGQGLLQLIDVVSSTMGNGGHRLA